MAGLPELPGGVQDDSYTQPERLEKKDEKRGKHPGHIESIDIRVDDARVFVSDAPVHVQTEHARKISVVEKRTLDLPTPAQASSTKTQMPRNLERKPGGEAEEPAGRIARCCKWLSSRFSRSEPRITPATQPSLAAQLAEKTEKYLASAKGLKPLEDTVLREITSKVFTSATFTKHYSKTDREEAPWDYDKIAVELLEPAKKAGIKPKRHDSSAGEYIIGEAIVAHYEYLESVCPEKKKDDLKRELVYRIIQLRETAEVSGIPDGQTDRFAPIFRDELLEKTKGFDSKNEKEQVEQLIGILTADKKNILGTITKPLYERILELLEARKSEL
jgi:hypothetical protein